MSDTTRVKLTQEIKKLQSGFDCILALKRKVPYFTLTPKQYAHYCAQITDKQHTGNPRYRGIEIKKMGEA